MSQKANPTTLGLFVVIGLALAVAAILALGSGKWFTRPHSYIVYFEDSVTGLRPGSAVMVSGVRVGQVQEVLIHFNQAAEDVSRPVIIDIDQNILNEKSDRKFHLNDEGQLQRLVDQGLRARLELESLVTGQLYVDLSIRPGEPPPVFRQVEPRFTEIPTAPNRVEVLLENLASMDLGGISKRVDQLLIRLDDTLEQLQSGGLAGGLTNLVGSLNAVVSAPGMTNLPATLERTLEETRLLAESLRTKVDPLAAGAQDALAQAGQTMAELQRAVEDLRGLLTPEAPLQQDLQGALDQISNASRSLSDLAEYLSRNPNALISGRKARADTP